MSNAVKLTFLTETIISTYTIAETRHQYFDMYFFLAAFHNFIHTTAVLCVRPHKKKNKKRNIFLDTT